MDAKQLEESVKKIVQETLEEHAAAGLESNVEEALRAAENAVSELTEQLLDLQKKVEDDAATIENLEGKAVELQTEMSSKEEELTALKSDHEALSAEAASVKEELDNIKKDMLMEARMGELEALKIARAGEALEKQKASVRVLTDEEFNLYKDEMVSIREEFLAQAEAERAASAAAEGEPGEGPDNSAAASTDSEDDEIDTPPADVDGAREGASILPPGGEPAKDNRFEIFERGLSMMLIEGRNKNKDK
jgi:chromosome segregation ATPase